MHVLLKGLATCIMYDSFYRSSTTPSVTQPSPPVQTPTTQAGPSSVDRKDTLEKEKRFVGIFSATLNHSISFLD